MNIFDELRGLVKALRDENIRYALCGGFALAVYGITRATEDIDIMIEESSLGRIRDVVAQLGFRFDPEPMVFKQGAIRMYRLFKTEGEDILMLDFLLVTPATEPAWDSRCEIETHFGLVPVVSPQGLIHLKSLRGSGQDQDDIRKLKELSDES